MSYIIRDENGGERVIAPWGWDTLIAHVNADGTAHDWQAPGHGGIRVPGGTINPHGQRGGITWGDGRAKYSREGVLKKIKEGWLDPSVLKHDDRFWPQDSRPGDGSSMTPEAQELYDSIFKEPVPQDDTSSVGELSFLNSFINMLDGVA